MADKDGSGGNGAHHHPYKAPGPVLKRSGGSLVGINGNRIPETLRSELGGVTFAESPHSVGSPIVFSPFVGLPGNTGNGDQASKFGHLGFSGSDVEEVMESDSDDGMLTLSEVVCEDGWDRDSIGAMPPRRSTGGSPDNSAPFPAAPNSVADRHRRKSSQDEM